MTDTSRDTTAIPGAVLVKTEPSTMERVADLEARIERLEKRIELLEKRHQP